MKNWVYISLYEQCRHCTRHPVEFISFAFRHQNTLWVPVRLLTLSVLLIHVLICKFVINKVEDPSVKSLVTLKVKENSTVTG